MSRKVIFFLLLSLSIKLFGQDYQTDFIQPDYYMQLWENNDGTHGFESRTSLQTMVIGTQYLHKYTRGAYQWDISDFNLPSNATISKVKIAYYYVYGNANGNMGLYFYELTHSLDDPNKNADSLFLSNSDNEVAQSWEPKLQTNIYESNSYDINNWCAVIDRAKQSGKLVLRFAAPGSESQGDEYYFVYNSHIELAIEYTLPYFVVKQKLSDGSEFGNINVWENNSWNSYQSSDTVFGLIGNIALQSDTSVYQNEKFNNWDQNSSFCNYEYFNIDANTNEVTSYFYPTKNGQIINSLESTNSYGGTVQFKDPWYRDDNSDTRGTRNRGLNAIYHSSSNFNLTTSSAYQGVFLGQGSPNWSPPYYSVKATSPQTIYVQGKNRVFYFQNWEAEPSGSATFQNANNLETPVVFNDADATVKAVMKGTGLSNNSNTYKANNQRKIVKTDDGNLHRVYESLGKVWYEMSTDDGVTWSIMNNGEPISSGEAKLPSISAKTGLNELIVVYQQKNGYHYDIVLECLGDLPRSTQTIYQEQTDLYSNDAYPLASLGKYGHTIILWAKNINYPTIVSGLFYWNGFINGKGVTTYTTGQVPYTDYNSVKPSIVSNNNSEKHLVWQQNGGWAETSIKYIRMTFNSTTLGIDFSYYSEPSNNGDYTTNKYPSITCFDSTPTIAWVSYDEVIYFSRVAIRRKGSGTNWATTEYLTDYDYDDEISVSINTLSDDYDGNEYMVAYVVEGDKVAYYLPEDGEGYLSPNNYDDYVQVCNGEAAFDDAVISTYNTGLAPYVFHTSTIYDNLSKTSNNSKAIKGRELTVTKNETEVKILLEAPTVNGKEINFVDIADTTVIKTKEDALALFTTEEFELNDNSDFTFTLTSATAVNKKDKKDKTLSEIIQLNVILIDAKTNEQLGLLKEVSSKKLTEEEKQGIGYKINTNGIGERTVKLLVSLDPKTVDNITIAKSSTLKGTELNKDKAIEVTLNEDLLVTEYGLSQNYPNPFNPTTTISYQIPEDSFVSLKVYDITGQEVATLVNKEQTTGKYKVSFDASSLSSGVYLYRIQSGSFTKSIKMILLK